MGKEIERLAESHNAEIVEIFDESRPLTTHLHTSKHIDVAIDFSLPTMVIQNITTLASAHINVVVGTTGWTEQKQHIQDVVLANSNSALVYGSNFSVGMQTFFRIVERAAQLARNLEDYDTMLHEFHHKRKKDSPSGTALTLSDIILRCNDRKERIEINALNEQIDESTLHVTSTRGGEIAGTHTLILDSFADTIECTHRAKNRSGFASGALLAAHWVKDKRKQMIDFTDIFEDVLSMTI
jgi:4-hydroxy-tetrahydrodipicolinate reductase